MPAVSASALAARGNNQGNQGNNVCGAGNTGPIGDPAGLRNIGVGSNFIGGGCVNNGNCASGCCACKNENGVDGGVCSGVGAAFQAGKNGCGFVDPNAQATTNAAKQKFAQGNQRRGFLHLPRDE